MAVLCCCCWPIHKCVSVVSIFDTLVVAYFGYKSFLLLCDTIEEPHWTTILAFLFFSAFLVCQLIATTFIILAHKKNLSHYCWPRLVLISGLLICSITAVITLLFYFGGAAESMNKFIFGVYEFFFADHLQDNEKKELKKELWLYALAFFFLTLAYAAYNLIELLLTRKFYHSLQQFTPLSQQEPSAPSHLQMSHNPDYNIPPSKIYPNYS